MPTQNSAAINGLPHEREATPLSEQRMPEKHRNQDLGDIPAQLLGVELPPATHADLLDPQLWQDGLAKFARATNLAVALADAAGRLIGSTINPRPTWSFLHSKTAPISAPSAGGVGCPFSLALLPPCNCVADASARGGVIMARDRTGLVHFAVPLVLGGQLLGALVAGQVFTRYPEQLPLERSAKQLLLSPGKVWELARLEHPIKQATLDVYADLLATLGQTFLQTHYHSLRERQTAIQLRQNATDMSEAERRKDEFLAMLSHELRNPLAPIISSVQLLSLQKNEGKVQQKARTIIERQVGQLTRLVDDLMEISRITTGRIHLQQERVGLNGIVEQALETTRPLMDQHKHELTVSLSPQPMWLDADAARIEQVIVNLLTNAAKYTPDRGSILLTVQRENDEAVLRLQDTGVGIAPELLPHIFDLFTQAKRTLDRSQGGLGIGLCLVKRLVEMHGGRVEVSSVVGKGSEFVVHLPVMMTPAKQPPSSLEVAAEPAGPTLRVLVVDDNVDAAESLGLLLEDAGHDVRSAYDGPNALEVAFEFRPNVVLLDIGLPKIDGYEVAKRLRQHPDLSGVVLVAMTGYGKETDKLRSHDAGFDHHLVKPADFGKVKEILATVSEKAT